MAKISNWGSIILAIGLIAQLTGQAGSAIGMVFIAAGLLIGAATLFKITINGINSGGKGTILTLSIVLGLLLVFGVTASPLMNAFKTQAPTASITETNVQTQEGAVSSAILKLNMKGVDGPYLGSGTVFALKPGVVTDRNDLMKKIYDRNTGSLVPNTMTLANGVYSFAGYNSKIGDQACFAGYSDSTPAATENVSFVKCTKITGLTAGSTPEFMLEDSSYVWYSYPTILYYYGDTPRSNYSEVEASAIEKTFTLDMFPTNNGEAWTDANLWIESPEANIAAIKRVKITQQGVPPVEYGMPVEVTSSESKFRARPALFTSTNKMYDAGAIPDGVRLSTNQKAKVTVEITYDHPASGNVVMRIIPTQNTNALTSAGGHFDSPATSFKLSLNATGNDGWDTE